MLGSNESVYVVIKTNQPSGLGFHVTVFGEIGEKHHGRFSIPRERLVTADVEEFERHLGIILCYPRLFFCVNVENVDRVWGVGLKATHTS